MYCLTVLDVRSLKSRHQQGYIFPLKSIGFLPCLFLVFGGSPTISGIPCFWDASLLSSNFTPHSSYVSSYHLTSPHVWVYVQISPFYKDTGRNGLGLTLMASTWLNPQRPYFQIRLHSETLGVRTSSYFLLGDTVQPLTNRFNYLQIINNIGVMLDVLIYNWMKEFRVNSSIN